MPLGSITVTVRSVSAFGSTGSGLLVLIGQTFSHVAVMIQGDCAAAVSSARGGQIIDRECADALGLDAERMRLLRERGVDLARPHTREEEAIAVYVRTTVAHLVLSLKGREGLLEIAAGASGGEIPVMLAGGFARTGGLGGPVGQELVPLTRAARIGEPEALEDPELAVLKGCMMVAAAQAVQ